MPLFVRISAADWADGPEKVGDEWTQWGIEQSTIFVKQMYEMGIDLVDCSSGGNWARQRIPVGPGYQVRRVLIFNPAVYLYIIGTLRCTSPRL